MVKEPVPFLANVVAVASADGVLTASELGQLEAIRQELKFKKSDMNSAVKLVEQGDYQAVPVGSFADQVKNLELMLRVAFADDDLDEAEAAILKRFCQKIGITQAQLDRIRKEVLVNLHQAGKVCPKCQADNDKDANFCAQCGFGFSQKDAGTQVKFDIPSSGIAIEFSDSTAAAFPKALELAKGLPGYQSIRRGNKSWHLAVFPSGHIEDALELAKHLSGMRNRHVYVNGEQKPWNEVFWFAWCAERRASAYRPKEYCFGKGEGQLNLWGCMQVHMDWSRWADWLTYGKWEKAGYIDRGYRWRFDKDRIRHELEANLHRVKFCPYLNADLALAVLKHLPDKVNPQTDPDWTYKRCGEHTPGAIKVVTKERANGYVYTHEFWSDGVAPQGLEGFVKILSKVFKEAGIDPKKAKSLANA